MQSNSRFSSIVSAITPFLRHLSIGIHGFPSAIVQPWVWYPTHTTKELEYSQQHYLIFSVSIFMFSIYSWSAQDSFDKIAAVSLFYPIHFLSNWTKPLPASLFVHYRTSLWIWWYSFQTRVLRYWWGLTPFHEFVKVTVSRS